MSGLRIKMRSFNRQWHERKIEMYKCSYVIVSSSARRHFEISLIRKYATFISLPFSQGFLVETIDGISLERKSLKTIERLCKTAAHLPHIISVNVKLQREVTWFYLCNTAAHLHHHNIH